MTHHEQYRRKVKCSGCGKAFDGLKRLMEHKPECTPRVEKPQERCTCFTGRDIRYNVDGTDVWPGHTYGLCQQHEGDAW